MISVGIVGIGFMGMIHYLAYQKLDNARVGAVVSRSESKRRGDWRGIQGNFGPAGEIIDLGNAKGYENLEQLVEDGGIDLVDICLPPSLHAEATILSLQAGKHVLCEKPMAVTLEDAERMSAAAQSSGKLLMIAHVLPFTAQYGYLRKIHSERLYGSLKGGSFKRIVSNPTWLPDYFDPVAIGGPLVDLHIHDAHFIRVLCGMPERVHSRGRLRNGVVDFAFTDFIYSGADAPLLSAVSGVIDQQGRPFSQAFEVYFDEATVLFDSSNFTDGSHTAVPLTVLEQDGSIVRPEMEKSGDLSAFKAELEEAIQAVEQRKPSSLLACDLARDALLLCHKQRESIEAGGTVGVSHA